MEAQSFRLTCEDAPSIEYMARFIAKTQQSYTQRGGVRPFGVSSMIAGISPEGNPLLFLTDPAGTYSSWKVKFNMKRKFNSYIEIILFRLIVLVDEMKKQYVNF